MIAALPMYDWAELHDVHDRFWSLIRDALRVGGVDAPDRLTRAESLWEVWRAPDLLLGQTCGLPYRKTLHAHVTLVGALDHGVDGAKPGYYRSALVVRQGDSAMLADYRERVFAFNGDDSQSGYAAAQNHVAPLGWRFTRALHTSAHRDSAAAVATGKADIACIDAVTWRLICRFRPDTANALQIIGMTEPTPGLPLITARTDLLLPLRQALTTALEQLDERDRAALGLSRALALLTPAEYLAVPTPPGFSQDHPAT
jgi:ABC-type phosphate/phosphonate transport system substrate-binding protein